MFLFLCIKLLFVTILLIVLAIPSMITLSIVWLGYRFRRMIKPKGVLITALISLYLSDSFFAYSIASGKYDISPLMLLAPFKVNIFADATRDAVKLPFLLVALGIMLVLYAVFGLIYAIVIKADIIPDIDSLWLKLYAEANLIIKLLRCGGSWQRYVKRQIERHKMSERYIE